MSDWKSQVIIVIVQIQWKKNVVHKVVLIISIFLKCTSKLQLLRKQQWVICLCLLFGKVMEIHWSVRGDRAAFDLNVRIEAFYVINHENLLNKQ